MKILIIGAVASGTSAGAKVRRNDENAQIIIYEKQRDISYSACTFPYYIGGDIENIEELIPRDIHFFKSKYNIDIKTEQEVLRIDKDKKLIVVKNLKTNELYQDSYDKLIIATGASAYLPNIDGIDENYVFSLRNVDDAKDIRSFIENNKPQSAIVVGTGFIGFEVCENLVKQNINTTFIEKNDIVTNNLDADMSKYLETIIEKQNIKLLKNKDVVRIENKKVVFSDDTSISSDLIIIATGVKPNINLIADIGVNIGDTGAIKVNEKMQTNIEDIYACGDCIETFCAITNKNVYRPLGSTANKTGRIAGDNITGGVMTYKGNLGTSIFKFFDFVIATSGLSEKEAIDNGYNIEICHNIKPDKSIYFNGQEMIIKAIADRDTRRLIGVQIIGKEGVDKRIDVFVTLMTYKATVDELFDLDLAYAPMFSTTKDPVHYTGMILDNAINNNRRLLKIDEIIGNEQEYQIIDTRSRDDYSLKGTVYNAVNIPHTQLRDNINQLDPNKKTLTFCNKGVTGNACQNILINNGFKEVYNLSGGHKFYKVIKD